MGLLETLHFTSGAKATWKRGNRGTIRNVGVGLGEVDAAVLHRCDVERVLHVLVDAAEGGGDVLIGMATGLRENRERAHMPRYTPSLMMLNASGTCVLAMRFRT